MISNQGLTCPKGTSMTFEIDMDSGSDLTGATAQWALAESWFDQAKVYLTKTGTLDGLFINQESGVWKIIVNLAPSDTLDVPAGLLYHDCKVLLQNGDVQDVANGPFTLNPSVNILDTNAPSTRNLHATQSLGSVGQAAAATVTSVDRNLAATQALGGIGQVATMVHPGAPDYQADFTVLTSLPAWINSSNTPNLSSSGLLVGSTSDVITLTGGALTAVQNAASSVIIEVDAVPTDYGAILATTDGATLILRNGSSSTQLFTQANGVAVVASVANTQATFRVGLSRDSGGVSLVGNGGTVATDSSAAAQSLTGKTVQLGGRVSDSNYINGHIRSVAIYSSRLSNANLQTKSVVGATY